MEVSDARPYELACRYHDGAAQGRPNVHARWMMLVMVDRGALVFSQRKDSDWLMRIGNEDIPIVNHPCNLHVSSSYASIDTFDPESPKSSLNSVIVKGVNLYPDNHICTS